MDHSLSLMRYLILVLGFISLVQFADVSHSQASSQSNRALRSSSSPQPTRIVTLAPSLAELVAELIPGELSRVVGVSEYTDYPPVLLKVESIGPYHRVNLEKILSLRPDLVLALTDTNPMVQVERLKSLGVPVVELKVSRLSEVAESIKKVAIALGVPQVGEEREKSFSQDLKAFEAQSRHRLQKPRVLLQVGDSPLVVVGSKSYLNDVLIQVGAENIYSDSPLPYLTPSREDILQRKPDFVLILALENQLSRYARVERDWEMLSKKNGRRRFQVILLKSDELARPSQRILHGMRKLSEVLFSNQMNKKDANSGGPK